MLSNQKMIAVNTDFDSLKNTNIDEISFTARTSYLDYDAVIIDTNKITSNYNFDSSSPYKNRVLLTKDSSNQISDDFKRIKEQLTEILKQGKNVFVLMGENESCYIYTGQKQYDGTGKNARVTDLVNLFDVYSFLPIKIQATHLVGTRYELCEKQPYFSYFRKIKECFYYSAYFTAESKDTLVKISGSDKAISAVYSFEKGNIILLPYPYLESEYTDPKNWKIYGKKYLDALFDLDSQLRFSFSNTSLPSWAEEILILNEKKELEQLHKDEKTLSSLLVKIEKQKENLSRYKRYKSILTSSGVALEEIVKMILCELGFVMTSSENGRSDIIATYQDISIVVEVKGVTKSAAEKHGAQLEKWVAQYIEENEVTPKPLLIVNGFVDTPISQRSEEVFPNQMLKYCESRNHALVTTTQLLCLYIDATKNPSSRDEKIDKLLKTTGRYMEYRDYSEYIDTKGF